MALIYKFQEGTRAVRDNTRVAQTNFPKSLKEAKAQGIKTKTDKIKEQLIEDAYTKWYKEHDKPGKSEQSRQETKLIQFYSKEDLDKKSENNARGKAVEKRAEENEPINDGYVAEKAFDIAAMILGPEEILAKGLLKNMIKSGAAKLLKKSVILPTKINTNLSENMMPFISKITPSYTKEEKIFNSFLSPESQTKKIKDATKHYDKNGNLLKNKNFYTEDTGISSFQLEDLDNSDIVEKTLSDFKNRISTKEGLKRAKKLNINVDKLNKLKSNTASHDDIAFYDNNVINVSSQIPKKHISNISRHEIEHAIQHAAPYNGHPVAFTKIDESLNELILKNDSELFDNYEHPPGRTVSETIENTLNRPGEAKEYFKRISEKSAFLSEVQQSMLDNKIIKHAYEKITPETVKKLKHTLDTKNDNSLRLMSIIKDDNLNYKIIARNLNRMLVVPGVTTGLLYKNNKDNGNTK